MKKYTQSKIITKINSIIFSYCSIYNNLQKRTSISVKVNDMKYQKFIKINLVDKSLQINDHIKERATA